MALLDSISNITNDASILSTFANKAIVKPSNYYGINGYVFDGIDFEEIYLKSQITNHYIENNTAIQDHIAKEPEIITVKGYVGELVTKSEDNELGYLSALNSKLQLLSSYLPSYTAQAQKFYNQLKNAYQNAMKIKQTTDDFYNKFFRKKDISTAETNQSKIFNFFYQMWDSRQIFTVQIYAKTFENMAILDVKYAQDGDQNMMSDVSVTFQKIRFAITPNITNKTDKHSQSVSSVKNLGNTKPDVSSNSILRDHWLDPMLKTGKNALNIFRKFFKG